MRFDRRTIDSENTLRISWLNFQFAKAGPDAAHPFLLDRSLFIGKRFDRDFQKHRRVREGFNRGLGRWFHHERTKMDIVVERFSHFAQRRDCPIQILLVGNPYFANRSRPAVCFVAYPIDRAIRNEMDTPLESRNTVIRSVIRSTCPLRFSNANRIVQHVLIFKEMTKP